MSYERSRSKEQIFTDMHRELRRWNPNVPESVDRMDTILKILLQLYAYQLERIDKRIDKTWDVAVDSLIKSLAPESKRWPVPAFTIMKCEIADPVVEIDPNTRFFYKEKREGGQTFFFSATKNQKLISAEVRHIFLRFDDLVYDLSPSDQKDEREQLELSSQLSNRCPGQIYLAVEYDGMPSNLLNAILFLRGSKTVLKQMRWGYWYPGSNFGEFYEDSGFCPGLVTDVEDLFSTSDDKFNWGGLRSSQDLFSSLENNFVILPEKFSSTWEIGDADTDLSDILKHNKIDISNDSRFYWIRVDLPDGGDKKQLKKGFDAYFNCCVATNKNELSTYKYTGGNKLVELEIPEEIENIFEITSVVDSNGEDYQPRYKLQNKPSQYSFALEERNNRLVLWFDFASLLEAPPDYITAKYSVTAGVSANGIEVGQINELYEKHPGISTAENMTRVMGAIPAKTSQQIIAEVSSRLRNRDRVLNFSEIVTWVKTFDVRIKNAECKNSIERAEKGVRRCIVVNVYVSGEDFYSDDETSLLKVRLNRFLKSRSTVNTNYQVEIIRQ